MTSPQPGALALVGSGEYTPAMNATDRQLLGTLASTRPRVALIPAASGLEPGMPARWNERGVNHFAALGAEPLPLALLNRDDAHDQLIVTALETADVVYFSGGNPEYLVDVLRDTPAWRAIIARHAAGAVLAGCSAGAMMMSRYTLRVRQIAAGSPPNWFEALGVVPQLVVLPHFDRMAAFVGQDVFRTIIRSAPAGITLVGVDEDTALVQIGSTWHVSGRQAVHVFDAEGSAIAYRPGDPISLS